MEHDGDALEPTSVVARRVRELREKRRLTAADLAAAMTRAGIKWDRSTVAKLETGRRENISVAELLALADVLNVAPVHLLVPLDDEQPYQVTPTRVEPAGAVRDWIRGAWPLEGTDLRDFYSEVPEHEFQAERTHVAGQLGTYQVRRYERLSPAERRRHDVEQLQRFVERAPTPEHAAEARRLLAELERER